MLLSIRNVLGTLIIGLSISAGVTAQSPTTQRDYIKRGNEKYARAEYQEAIEEYRHIKSNAGKTYAQALYNIGVCYYELWRTEDAITWYKQAIKAADGRYAKAFFALGIALEDLNQFNKAKEAYRRAIQASDNDYPPAHFRLGVIAANENDKRTALEAFKAAIASSKMFPASHNNLGVMLARNGSLLEAEKEFQLALREAGGVFPEAERNLALCRSLLTPATTELVSWLMIR